MANSFVILFPFATKSQFRLIIFPLSIHSLSVCGEDPHTLRECIENGGKSIAGENCPDVMELENGDFAIIGVRITKELKDKLPESFGCGSDEEIVLVPRYVLSNAKKDIPDYEY